MMYYFGRVIKLGVIYGKVLVVNIFKFIEKGEDYRVEIKYF